MKTMILLLTLVIIVFVPMSVFSGSCAIISAITKGQYVHILVQGTYHGIIKGKVVESNPSNCILIIATTTDYPTYYINAEEIAAIGVR